MLGKITKAIKGSKPTLKEKIVIRGTGFSSKATIYNDINIPLIKHILNTQNFTETMKLYRTMLKRDWQISGDLGERKIRIIAAKHSIEGGDKKALDLINTYFKNIKLTSLLADINSGIDYGYSIIDLIWESKNINNITYFLPTKFNFINHVLIQKDDRRGIYIQDSNLTKHFLEESPYKLLFHTHKMDSGDILDYSTLSKLIWIFAIKHFIVGQSMNYCELLGVPPIVVNSSATDKETILQMFEQVLELRSGSAGVFGKDDKVSLVEGKANGEMFMKFIKYADNAISHIILGGTMSSSDSSSGSYARDKTHNDIKESYHKADMALISETVNDLIKKICDLNFSDLKEYPTFALLFETSSNTQNTIQKNGREINNTNISKTNIKEYNSTSKPFDHIDKQLNELDTKNIEKETLSEIYDIINEADSYQEAVTMIQEQYGDLGLEELNSVMSDYIANATIQGHIDE
ncbi:phage portal protein family protein [Arcobacter sp.]|uniref:phage portal protein family protein n=1 Tax=unclassified Arcobacter TaxID=2593671 RepID=UPI003B009C7C